MREISSGLVVLVHGFGGKRLAMEPLRHRLRHNGYRVASWTYPSLRATLDQHGSNLFRYLTDELYQEPRIHIVAHSMGSIVTRVALTQGSIFNIGRIVFFAPPHHGTPAARHASRLAGRLCTPIADLSDSLESAVNKLPPLMSIEVGIVAAKFDALVPVSSTHLHGEREHIVLNATHNSLLWSRRAAALATTFIAAGCFQSPLR